MHQLLRVRFLVALLASASPAVAQDERPHLTQEPTVFCRHVAGRLDVARATSGPESYYINTVQCPDGDETISDTEFSAGVRSGNKRAPATAATARPPASAPAPVAAAGPRPARPERPSRYIITVMFCSADNCEMTKPETATYSSYAECSSATLSKSSSLNDWIAGHRSDNQRSGEILCLRVSQTFR